MSCFTYNLKNKQVRILLENYGYTYITLRKLLKKLDIDIQELTKKRYGGIQIITTYELNRNYVYFRDEYSLNKLLSNVSNMANIINAQQYSKFRNRTIPWVIGIEYYPDYVINIKLREQFEKKILDAK